MNWRPPYWHDLEGEGRYAEWSYRACVTGAALCFVFALCIPIAAALAALFD